MGLYGQCAGQEQISVLFTMAIRGFSPQKFSVVVSNGLMVIMNRRNESRRHDSGMLACSGLLPLVQVHSQLGPFKGANKTVMQ